MKLFKKIGNFIAGIFKDKQKLFIIIAILMFILGFMCLGYPVFAKMHNERVSTHAVVAQYQSPNDEFDVGVTIP